MNYNSLNVQGETLYPGSSRINSRQLDSFLTYDVTDLNRYLHGIESKVQDWQSWKPNRKEGGWKENLDEQAVTSTYMAQPWFDEEAFEPNNDNCLAAMVITSDSNVVKTEMFDTQRHQYGVSSIMAELAAFEQESYEETKVDVLNIVSDMREAGNYVDTAWQAVYEATIATVPALAPPADKLDLRLINLGVQEYDLEIEVFGLKIGFVKHDEKHICGMCFAYTSEPAHHAAICYANEIQNRRNGICPCGGRGIAHLSTEVHQAWFFSSIVRSGKDFFFLDYREARGLKRQYRKARVYLDTNICWKMPDEVSKMVLRDTNLMTPRKAVLTELVTRMALTDHIVPCMACNTLCSKILPLSTQVFYHYYRSTSVACPACGKRRKGDLSARLFRAGTSLIVKTKFRFHLKVTKETALFATSEVCETADADRYQVITFHPIDHKPGQEAPVHNYAMLLSGKIHCLDS